MIPVFKADNHLDVDNYRPMISLLSSISKVHENIVADKLIYHLLSKDLIYQHQYGFLPIKSTEHHLLHIVNFITNALKVPKQGNFLLAFFALSEPIWVGDLGTETKNPFFINRLLILMVFGFLTHTECAVKKKKSS